MAEQNAPEEIWGEIEVAGIEGELSADQLDVLAERVAKLADDARECEEMFEGGVEAAEVAA